MQSHQISSAAKRWLNKPDTINNPDANHDDLNINVMETDFETIGKDQFENETDEESLDEDVQCETETETETESNCEAEVKDHR